MNIFVLPVSGITFSGIKLQNIDSLIHKKDNIIPTSNLEADLKVRKIGGNWADESITVDVGTILECHPFHAINCVAFPSRGKKRLSAF